MSKYDHKAKIENVVVVGKLLHFLRQIQYQVQHEYKYYVTGSFKPEKIISVINKLDLNYRICETSVDRSRRYKLNQSTVQMIIFFPLGANEVYFILLARAGCNGSKDHIFFSAEKYKDLTLKKESFIINHYVLKRINKEQYTYNDDNGAEKIIPGKNEVWTYDLTENYLKDVIANIRIALIRRDHKTVNQLLRSFENVIPFHKVRTTYQKTSVKINRMVEKFCNATGKDSSLESIQFLKNKLNTLRATAIEKLNLEDLLNNSVLKKTKQ